MMMSAIALNNDMFILSTSESLGELNFTNTETSAATIHGTEIKTFVLDTEEGAVHYRLEDPDACDVEPPGALILPHLERRKYLVQVISPESCNFTDGSFADVSNDEVSASTSKRSYDPEHFFTTNPTCHSDDSDKVIPRSNYSSSDYLMYSNIGHNSESQVQFKSKNKSTLLNKNSSTKSLRSSVKTSKIPPQEFKKQLLDTSDIVSPLMLLPHSKRLVEISSWNFDKSLITPQRCISGIFKKHFERNCISNKEENDIDSSELELMPLGYKPEIDLTNIKRIIRKRKNPCLYQGETESSEKVIETIKPDKQTAESEENPVEYVEALLGNENEHEKCYFFGTDLRDSEEIIVIHDGQETAENTAYTQQNIDVLLAAAANNPVTRSLVIQQKPDQLMSVNRKGIFKGSGQQIIIV